MFSSKLICLQWLGRPLDSCLLELANLKRFNVTQTQNFIQLKTMWSKWMRTTRQHMLNCLMAIVWQSHIAETAKVKRLRWNTQMIRQSSSICIWFNEESVGFLIPKSSRPFRMPSCFHGLTLVRLLARCWLKDQASLSHGHVSLNSTSEE